MLDLGSATGSFDVSRFPCPVIQVDLEARTQTGRALFVQADASQLPFRNASFDFVIANHSLEHFERLDVSIRELTRVLKPDGGLYDAVPDASTLCDKLYRWLASGRGHVNPFVKASDLKEKLSQATGLPCRGTVDLHTGFSYLNRTKNSKIPTKAWLIGGGYEPILRLASLLFRLFDRTFATRLSVYGWAYYFGSLEPGNLASRTNVCIRCGAGHPSSQLIEQGRVTSKRITKSYPCPNCTSKNFFLADKS